MKTMFRHRILAGAVLFTALLGFSSCEDEPAVLPLEYADKTLYEVIANDDELSDFFEVLQSCSIEDRDLADSLFNHARVYTVWAPKNGYVKKDSLLARIADGYREDVMRTFVFSHIANHLRPANGELEKGNLVVMLNNKMSSFEGSYKDGKYSFGDCKIEDGNIRVWNGLLHKLGGTSEYRYNIWEYLKIASDKSNGYRVDSIANCLYSYNITEFDPGSSILGTFENGAQTYLDSVWVTTNQWLNVYSGVGPLDAEDSLYTVYIPTNEAWESTLAEAREYYRYDHKQNLPSSMDSAFIDSIRNYYPLLNVLKFISYSENEQRYVPSYPDSVMPAYRGAGRRRFAWSQLNENVKFSKELSNGVFKIVDKMPYNALELWHDTIRIEAEDAEMLVNEDLIDVPIYRRYVSKNQINPALGTKSELSGGRYFEATSDRNKLSAIFCLPNVLSAKYKVAMIVVPKHITNPSVKEEELKPTQFTISITQAEAGTLYSSLRKIKSDPTRLDTIFLTESGSGEPVTIEFPYCERYNTHSRKDFTTRIQIQSDGGLLPKNFDMSLRLDAILLIPVLDTEE